jgi:hypothetical protein
MKVKINKETDVIGLNIKDTFIWVTSALEYYYHLKVGVYYIVQLNYQDWFIVMFNKSFSRSFKNKNYTHSNAVN